MSTATPERTPSTTLALAAAATAGYYLAADLVKGRWRRRLVRGGILLAAGGAGIALEKDRRSEQPPAPAPEAEHVPGTATGHGEVTGQHGQFTPQNAAVAAAGATAIGVGALVSSRIDRAVPALVSRTLGKLPLVGGLVRRFPNTVWGLAQISLIPVIDRAGDRVARAVDAGGNPTTSPQFR
mgnify:CR=1 FL=1|jgi:hypothetical protein